MSDVETWDKVRLFMDKHCGVSLASDQIYLLEGRLLPVAKTHGCASVAQFVGQVCTGGAQTPMAQSLIDAMTTHETYFFRDTPFWQAFGEVVLKRLVAAGRRSLRIWSAACSHGQEVYTIQMLIAEQFPQLAGRVTIVATDVSDAAVQRAREGVYSTLEVNRGLTAVRMVKHFEKAPGGFRVKQALRDGVIWRPHNLLEAIPAGGPFDIVMCRNVFIYFSLRDRKIATDHLLQSACPDGFIGMGTSEVYLQPSVAPGWYDCSTKGSSKHV